MKKPVIGILIFIAFVVCFWFAGQITHAFISFSSPSKANEPAIKKGETFFVSNLVRPKMLDFICFYATTPQEGRSMRVSRLCGTAGDTVEIRNGILFVNGKNIDQGLSLAHDYFMPKNEYEKNKNEIGADEEFEVVCFPSDTCGLPVSDKTISDLNIHARKSVFRKDSVDDYISKLFHGDFNADNFGPIVLPANKYFVLGDNRHRAEDSRFLGLIDRKDYVATVLWHK